MNSSTPKRALLVVAVLACGYDVFNSIRLRREMETRARGLADLRTQIGSAEEELQALDRRLALFESRLESRRSAPVPKELSNAVPAPPTPVESSPTQGRRPAPSQSATPAVAGASGANPTKPHEQLLLHERETYQAISRSLNATPEELEKIEKLTREFQQARKPAPGSAAASAVET